MDLHAYFRILWRRWWLILALTVLGIALGVGSTLFDESSASNGKAHTFYKATNTLVLDTPRLGSDGGGFQPAFNSLDQIALLTTTGDVPDTVAKKLGSSEDGRKLAERVITTVNGSTSTIDVTAAEPTADEAVETADGFADALIANLQQRDVDRYNQQRQYLSDRINNLTSTVNQLTGQLAANPADRVVAAQLNTAQNELGNTLSDFGSLTATGPPGPRLSSLARAQAVPIDQAEYQSRLNAGALGQNHVSTGGPTSDSLTVVAASDDTALSGPAARGLLGGLLGFIAGVALALLLERLNRRIRTPQDAETAFGLPVLAEVPEFKRAEQRDKTILVAEAPLSRVAEAFRAVRSSLLFTRAVGTGEPASNGASGLDATGDNGSEPHHNEPYVVMVTSPGPSEGKTTCTANLAAVFAEAGYSVLAVNCDFRRPTLHACFGVADEPRRVLETSLPGVKVVTNVLNDPAANPSQVVAAQRHVIAAARGRFDVILLDTAPLLTANDAVELVGSADVVLLVARIERTRFDSASRCVEVLNRLDAPLGGVVLSGAKATSNDYYYYYQPGRVDAQKPVAPTVGAGPAANGNGAASDQEMFGDTPAAPAAPSAPPEQLPQA